MTPKKIPKPEPGFARAPEAGFARAPEAGFARAPENKQNKE
ncbi:MAG: hypothetical protein Q4Q53_02360 [Methanocorpusculum sp.]|nr:hypothetical protein [Methanocorpusculum sp.]